jgi:hypothetical protein
MSYPETMTEHTNNGRPTRYAIIDGKRVPLDYEAARALALNAHLLALGDPKRAAQMVAGAERAKREQITA